MMFKSGFDRYLVVIMLRSGLYHIEEVNDHKLRKWYAYKGHRYEWDTGGAFRLIGWFPWQVPTMNPILFLVQWVQRRLVSVGVLLYSELPDPPDETMLISPLTHVNHVTRGYSRVHPALFRGAILSPLYKRYQKVRFGAFTASTKSLLIVFGVFAGLVILLYMMGWWG